MVTAEMAHPSAEKLNAFALGRLDDAASAEIEDHLATCEACQRLVEDTPADSLMETLREPAPAAAAKPAESRPGLFTRLAAIVDPQAPKPAQPPAARSHQDVPAELRDHPRYEVLERLGAGGMGTVFKARHRLMDRVVALKVMNPQLLADPTAVGRFQREVKAAAQLAHPHIVTAHDAEQVGGLHFLAMEYVEGQTLAEVVDAKGPLPVQRACETIRQAALGLQYAHERGMVHRDIKPQNLVLTPAGQVKVFDFGLARFVSESGEPGEGSSCGKMLGSPDYMAPEQAKDAHIADIRADIYSLGCTLYHLLAGLPPFPGGSAVEKLAAHLEKTPIEISKLRLDIPDGLQRIVDRMLAKDPQQRFQTPGEVAAALEPFCKPGPAVAPAAQAAPTARPQRRRVSLIAAAAILLLFGATSVFFAGPIYRFVTDQGTLVIETDDPDVEVIVKQGGRQITIVDSKTDREVTLKAGEYQLELAAGQEGLKLSTTQFRLTRGSKQIASVRFEIAQKTPPADPFASNPTAPKSATELLETRPFVGHRQQVTGLVFLPDGRQVLSGSQDETVRLWDVARGKEVRRYEGASAQIQSVAVSPDGQWVVAGGDGGLIQLWDMAAKPIRQFEGHKQTVASVAFAPDNRFLLSGSVDGTVRLWDVNAGKEQRRFPGHEGGVTCVDFSPDSRYVLSSGNDALVRLWDQETGQELRSLAGHTAPVTSVAFSPDGRLVLSGSIDKTMGLWDAETGQLLRSVSHPSSVNRIAFSPDGRRVLSGSGERIGNTDVDGCVRLWDVASGQELGRFEGHRTAVESVAFSPDGRQAVTASWDNTVRLLKLPEPPSLPITEVRSFPESNSPLGAIFSPDGRQVLSRHLDRSLRLWDSSSGQEVRRLEGRDVLVGAVAFSADGRLALSGSHGIWKDRRWMPTDTSVRLWDVTTGREIRRFQGHTSYVLGVGFTTDGLHVLSAGLDATLRSWDATTGEPLRVFEGHTGGIRCMTVSADGRHVLSGSDDKTVRLWDVATGRELRRLEGHTDAVLTLTVSPDGRRAVSGGCDKTLRLWNVETGRQLRVFPGHTGAVETVAFSPDGKLVLSGGHDRTVRLWDVATGQELGRHQAFVNVINGVSFSPDGQSALVSEVDVAIHRLKLPAAGDSPKPVASGDTGQLVLESEAADGWLLVKQRDKVVLVLDATANQKVDLKPGEYQLELAGRTEGLRLSADKFSLAKGTKQVVQVRRESKAARVEITEFRSLLGHRNSFSRVRISPDGRHLLSCGRDNTVRLLDVVTGKEVRRFEGQVERLACAAFSPDGRLVAGGGDLAWKDSKSQESNFSVWLWDVATGKLMHRFEGHAAQVPGVAISPDGQYLVTGSWDGTVRLWDIPGKQPGHVLKAHSPVNAVAFSPDGRSILSGGHFDKAVRLWDAQFGKELHVLEGHGAPVMTVAFSPDGIQALSASDDRTMRLWDVRSGRLQYAFPPQPGGIRAAFSPDGKRIISVNWASAGSSVRLWDVSTREEIGSFDSPNRAPWHADWSPDGRFVACTGSIVRLLWFSETGGSQKPASDPDKGQLAIETNGFDLPVVVTQPDKLVTVIVPKISKLAELPPGEYELELAGQPEDFRLSADKVTLTKGQKQTISILEVPPAKPPHDITEVRRFEGHTANIESVAFSPDGRWILSGSGDKSVRLWDVETGQEIRRMEGNAEEVLSVAFSPDGRQALSAGDTSIRLWDPATGKETRCLQGHTSRIWSARFSPDGRLVLSGSADSTLRLWDAQTGAELRKFTGHEGEVRCVAFSPDGRRALSASYDGSVRLWDVGTGNELRRFDRHTEWVMGVAFSPDGRQAVSSGWDKTVRLWDVETGQQLRSFSGLRSCPLGVAFAPDGRRILADSGWRTGATTWHAGFDYCARLWDVATGDELARFVGHTAPPVTIVFSPDGRTALSAGYDNTIRLLKLPERSN